MSGSNGQVTSGSEVTLRLVNDRGKDEITSIGIDFALNKLADNEVKAGRELGQCQGHSPGIPRRGVVQRALCRLI